MKRLKIAGLLATAVLGLAVFAGVGTAEATVLCTTKTTPECSPRYPIATTLRLSLKSGTTARLTSGGSTIATCSGSEFTGKTHNELEPTISVLFEKVTWSGCSQTTDTIALGSLAIQGIEGTYNGKASGSSLQVTTVISGASCTYGFGSSRVGTLTGGEEAVLDVETTLSKIEGGSSCPSAPTWEAEYTLTEPHALYIIQTVPTTVGGTLCTETGTPSCAASYAKGTEVDLSLKSGSSMTLASTGGGTLVTCSSGTVSGQVGAEAESNVMIETLESTWSGCSAPNATVANGSLSVQWIAGTHNGTLNGKSVEWIFELFGVTCTYGFGTGTHLGTLTGGEAPTLVISTTVTKTAGTFLCPSSATFKAEYIVTSPHSLYVDEEHIGIGGILCTDALTPECTRSFSKGRPIDLSLKSGSSMRLTNAGSTIATCTGGTIKGSVGTESTNTVAINVSEATWSTCSQTADTISAGLLEIKHVEGTHNGAVTGKSTAGTFEIFGVSCTYGFGEGTHIGTLLSGETPMLNISTTVPRTAGGFLCPSTVGFDAEYVVTEPHALYVI